MIAGKLRGPGMRIGLMLVMLAALMGQGGAQSVRFKVRLGVSVTGPLSGRLLVFMKQGRGDASVDSEEFAPSATWVTARDVHDVAPGATVEVDATEVAFPQSFAAMPAGDWEAQAVLDPDGSYNYGGRSEKDWVGPVVALPGFRPGVSAEPVLMLDRHAAAAAGRGQAEAKAGEIERVEMESPALTRFWGRATLVRAYVVLPPGYAEHPQQKYPTAYWTAGFGGVLRSGLDEGVEIRRRMEAGTLPPMIWVMLDESCAQGTHEFADSVNNGPWGQALTAEYIPLLEDRYRMDGRPAGRLLNGHSSGGWATLQLQVNYPRVFGGTWSTSPDPSDFHDFTGPDLYAPGANVYRKPDGSAWPIMRADGKVVATFEQFARLEQVIGPYGGQVASFEWVFSPKGASGAPLAMFDRATGAVDAKVVAYWGAHYDLANLVEKNWTERGAMLRGRIHVMVGTADTFYLDGAAHRFEARLLKLGAEAKFTYVPGRTHFDLYGVGDDPQGLLTQIGAEMYAVARPGVRWRR